MRKLYLIMLLSITILLCRLEPERPQHVSENAFWKGGVKGGYWFDVLDKKNNQIRIKIYNDYTGKLIEDSYFELEKKCYEKYTVDKNFIEKYLLYWNHQYIVLEIDSIRCLLVPLKYRDKYF